MGYEGNFGKKGHSGVMATSAVPLEMPAKQPSKRTLRVRGEKWRFIHEAEDFAVFSPSINKKLIL
jgi:hypothetical protein